MKLQERIDAALTDGFEIVQEGRIILYDGVEKETFADRAEGFKIGMLGTFAPPTYRSQFENWLFDDAERWVHLRKLRQ
jgi:hypothetical protein